MSQMETVDLPAVININSINELKLLLDEALLKNCDVEMNGADITKADTASMQLICAFNEKLKSSGHSMCWSGVSDECKNVAEMLGLNEIISIN
ncbi:MAG: STAS domain-containing protein [Gammaproteobacteria bacterium]|nr:STAS domain-containing protein [Gammaproteobacteria bacterium]